MADWFQQHARSSPTPYGMARTSPTPYRGSSAASLAVDAAGRASATRANAPVQRSGGGAMRGVFGALGHPFSAPQRGAVKTMLTTLPFSSSARGAVKTVLTGRDPRQGAQPAQPMPAQGGTIGDMLGPVTMRGPDGSTRQVSAADVAKYQALGAQVEG